MVLRSILFCLIVAAAVAGVAAQSGGGGAAPGKKANAHPQPTATPQPEPTAIPAGGTDASADDGDVIKVTTQVVSVPVRVMDKKGRFIAGLKRDEFKVFEDGVEQDIAYFSTEEEPFTVVLMLDMSY